MYVSKVAYAAGWSGSGTSADAPTTFRQAFLLGISYVLVVGAGVYRDLPAAGEFRDGAIGTGVAAINADGEVKVLGDGSTLFRTMFGRTAQVYDIAFEQFGGINFHGNDGNSTPTGFFRCIFKCVPETANAYNSRVSGPTVFTDCILYNVNLTGYANIQYPLYATFNNCIFINCTVEDSTAVNRCYIDPTSSIRTRSATGNNIDPGCNADLGKGLNVVASVNANSTPNYTGGWNATNPQGIRALPLFNSVAKEDFTLRIDSPHLGSANIGPSHRRYSNSFYAEFSGGQGDAASLSSVRFRSVSSNYVAPLVDITTGAQAFDVNSQGGLLLRPNSNSDFTGYFTTGAIPHADQVEEISSMLLKAGLNFNTEFPATEGTFNPSQPEIYNNNVPDWSNGAPSSALRNPARLSYRMRWSTKLNPNPNAPEDWVTGNVFVEFEWNQKPLWNPLTLTGNGDAAFVAASGEAINCRWYQLQVRLRNNYYR